MTNDARLLLSENNIFRRYTPEPVEVPTSASGQLDLHTAAEIENNRLWRKRAANK